MEPPKPHWETIYRQKRPDEVSWYRPHLDVSLALLERAGLQQDTRIIDVGGGASTLVDDLLARGLKEITVLDVAGEALLRAKARLGARSQAVTWIEADIATATLPNSAYDLWHDRAVFHFLMRPEDRRRYVETLTAAMKPGGHVVMATFSLQGPPRCSGLEVQRYSAESLQTELGEEFRLLETLTEEHRTPFGTTQQFLYCRFQRIGIS